jgi:hypothetical protein
MVAAEGWELNGAQKRREAESESRKAESGKLRHLPPLPLRREEDGVGVVLVVKNWLGKNTRAQNDGNEGFSRP